MSTTSDVCGNTAWTDANFDSGSHANYCEALCADFSWCTGYLIGSNSCRILTDSGVCPDGDLLQPSLINNDGYTCYYKTQGATSGTF